jgi:hypothetical protein
MPHRGASLSAFQAPTKLFFTLRSKKAAFDGKRKMGKADDEASAV